MREETVTLDKQRRTPKLSFLGRIRAGLWNEQRHSACPCTNLEMDAARTLSEAFSSLHYQQVVTHVAQRELAARRTGQAAGAFAAVPHCLTKQKTHTNSHTLFEVWPSSSSPPRWTVMLFLFIWLHYLMLIRGGIEKGWPLIEGENC